jgi:hypothetical protein
LDFVRPPDEYLQPGDIFIDVPFAFALSRDGAHYEQVLRPAAHSDPDNPCWDRVDTNAMAEGDLRNRELAVIERRLICAMVHVLAPPCDIDKVVPPPDDARKVKIDEDATITFFECKLRNALGPVWNEKLSHADRHIRFAIVGPVPLTEADPIELAVNFRREQQLFRGQIDVGKRIASLTTEGLEIVRAAYDMYLR